MADSDLGEPAQVYSLIAPGLCWLALIGLCWLANLKSPNWTLPLGCLIRKLAPPKIHACPNSWAACVDSEPSFKCTTLLGASQGRVSQRLGYWTQFDQASESGTGNSLSSYYYVYFKSEIFQTNWIIPSDDGNCDGSAAVTVSHS